MIRSKLLAFLTILAIHLVLYHCQDLQTMNKNNEEIERNHKCKCVPYYQCDENNTIITNGESILTERKLPSDRIVCEGGKFKGFFACCFLKLQLDDLFKRDDFEGTLPKKQCGVTGPLFIERVFADEDESVVVDREFPWMVGVFIQDKTGADFKFHCSGSLIHPKVVLTVEHHFRSKKPNQFKVIVNGKAVIGTVGIKPDEERDIKEIVHHPDYYQGALHNDVALLILEEAVNMSGIVNTICLPPADISLEGMRCSVAGWGKDQEGKNTTRYLKKVEVPIVPNDKCQEKLRKEMMYDYDLDASFMCAGGEENKDACRGDGGSPLSCHFPSNKNRSFVAGIVSWGLGCGLKDVPGVYTDVSVMRQWIELELEKHNISLD